MRPHERNHPSFPALQQAIHTDRRLCFHRTPLAMIMDEIGVDVDDICHAMVSAGRMAMK
jgi:hypothetical protein